MHATRLERSVPAEPAAVRGLRRELSRYATALGAVETVRHAVELAVTEAVTNAVIHAYVGQAAGQVLVEAWQEEGHLYVLVCDDGCGMRPRLDSPGLGLGLNLIAQMADDMRIADRPDTPGTRLSMRFSLDGSGTAPLADAGTPARQLHVL